MLCILSAAHLSCAPFKELLLYVAFEQKNQSQRFQSSEVNFNDLQLRDEIIHVEDSTISTDHCQLERVILDEPFLLPHLTSCAIFIQCVAYVW